MRRYSACALRYGVAGSHPTPAACNLVQLLAPTIAYAVDPLRSPAVLARLVQGMTAASVLTTSGATLPLPGLPAHPLLEANSAVLAAAVAHTGLRHVPGPVRPAASRSRACSDHVVRVQRSAPAPSAGRGGPERTERPVRAHRNRTGDPECARRRCDGGVHRRCPGHSGRDRRGSPRTSPDQARRSGPHHTLTLATLVSYVVLFAGTALAAALLLDTSVLQQTL
jgi:hypothetical protein